MSSDRDRLVIEHLHIADQQAARAAERTPSCFADDLRSAALEALLTAAQRFEPGHGVRFVQYASQRVHWAIIDEQRRLFGNLRTAAGGRRRRQTSLDAALPDGSRLDPPGQTHVAARAVDVVMVAGLLERLDARDARIVRMYYFDDLTLAEIGRRMGVSEVRICQRLTAIKGRLRPLVLAG
jgi:RNA polymerase sigma factor for flagellar operon FliA